MDVMPDVKEVSQHAHSTMLFNKKEWFLKKTILTSTSKVNAKIKALQEKLQVLSKRSFHLNII